jgi:hypothetical protein
MLKLIWSLLTGEHKSKVAKLEAKVKELELKIEDLRALGAVSALERIRRDREQALDAHGPMRRIRPVN